MQESRKRRWRVVLFDPHGLLETQEVPPNIEVLLANQTPASDEMHVPADVDIVVHALALRSAPHGVCRSSGPTRPRVLVFTEAFDASRVLALWREADLVLPLPQHPGVLGDAVRLLVGGIDEVFVAFAAKHGLSPRERLLMRCALEGLNNDEAAGRLGCSRATVSTYWNRIFRKTGVSGQRDVIVLLMRMI